MKKYVFIACVVIGFLALNVIAQIDAEQPAGRGGRGMARGEAGGMEGRGGDMARGRGMAGGRGMRGFGGRGGGGPLDETGFVQIFDGNSLDDWEGDARWQIVDGVITAENTAENPLQRNTFLIWRGGAPADFELKLDYRLTGGNSGIQYRSRELEGDGFAMAGYQSDMDADLRYAGMIYEERGRGFLAPRGLFNYRGVGVSGTIATLGDAEELADAINIDDWNAVHIIARGNTIVQIYNGRVMSILIDDDTEGRAMEGLIGLQLHTGPPMKIGIMVVTGK